MTTMRLGLAGGPIPTDPAAVTVEFAREMAALGVRALTTHFQGPPEALAGPRAWRVRDVLASEGIAVVQATGYNPNLVHPDRSARRRELERLRASFAAARDLGAEMVSTGCGSLHPTFFYGPAPENHHQETRDRLIASLRDAAPWAEEAGVLLALECHVLTTLDTPEHVRDILDAVGTPWVRANFDPVNFIGDLTTLYNSGPAIRHMGEIIGARFAPTAHIKDVAPQPDLVLHLAEVPPGEGFIDFDAVFEVCQTLGERAALIVEHLDAERVPAALAFVRAEAERRHIGWE